MWLGRRERGCDPIVGATAPERDSWKKRKSLAARPAHLSYFSRDISFAWCRLLGGIVTCLRGRQ